MCLQAARVSKRWIFQSFSRSWLVASRAREQAVLRLILLAESLGERFAVRVEEFLAALLPGRSELRRRDIPVRPAFPGHCSKVLAKIFHRGPPEKPVTVVDLVNDQTGLENNHVGDHRIVDRIRVLGDVE